MDHVNLASPNMDQDFDLQVLDLVHAQNWKVRFACLLVQNQVAYVV